MLLSPMQFHVFLRTRKSERDRKISLKRGRGEELYKEKEVNLYNVKDREKENDAIFDASIKHGDLYYISEAVYFYFHFLGCFSPRKR